MSLKNIIAGACLAASLAGCGSELKENVNVCIGALPQKYEEYLVQNQNIASSLIWDGSTKLQFAEDCSALSQLSKHIQGEIELLEPPKPKQYNEKDDAGFFSEEDAFEMYLAHAANSLILEFEDALPWKLKDYDRGTNRMLLDGRNFMQKTNGLYTFNDMHEHGRYGVTDWNPKPVLDFIVKNNLLKATQEETIYAITDWMRDNLVHISTVTPENWDDYEGFPPVDKILNAEKKWTMGCWGTTSLYMAMLNAVNVPVKRGYSLFATTLKRTDVGVHSRPEFPTLGIGLIHGDDPYAWDFKGKHNKVPVERLFFTSRELEQMIDNPRTNEVYKPAKAELAAYNANKTAVSLAVEYLADLPLVLRAYDLLGGKLYWTLDDYLKGKTCTFDGINYKMCFWKPLMDEKSIQQAKERIDEELRKIGNGDLEAGCRKAMTFLY